MRRLILICATLLASLCLEARTRIDKGIFDGVCDSLGRELCARTSVRTPVKLSSVLRRGSELDFYFTRDLEGFPLTREDIGYIRETLKGALSNLEGGYRLGKIFTNSIAVEELTRTVRVKDPAPEHPFIEQKGARRYPKGLDRRIIAVWQSHGKFYNSSEQRWMWQRAPLHGTVEDLYTQSYVLPFLIPMLENAGAYVMTPRERDTGCFESVADNDSTFADRPEGVRTAGRYSESGSWQDAGTGFADKKAVYCGDDNPFVCGTARKAACVPSKVPTASATWVFSFPKRGTHSVYISYKSLPESSSCARYTVHHLNGDTEFTVNQTIGGSTWIRLGEFEFSSTGAVTLDNSTPSRRKYAEGSVVTADGVRIGGGMGKIARDSLLSGLPAYAEGAMYSLQWSGFDKKVWGMEATDYINDYSCRPYWVKEIRDNYGMKVNMALAFHSDAGTALKDSTIGTLAIYTYKSEGSTRMSDDLDRMTCRHLSTVIQDEVVRSIRGRWKPDWNRRELRNRSYREARATDVPTMLLELLSHQNFGDMKYGLDPQFRFDVSRAVYTGMLKYMAALYGTKYVVQPLPVKDFSASWTPDGNALLKWAATEDEINPDAKPKGYTVYTRIDDSGFGKGVEVSGTSTVIKIEPGHIYSFKVEAWNEGGRSFPSEILSIGRPVATTGCNVLIVNNFTRVSGPGWIEGDELAGFTYPEESGVPYMEDISYIGDVYDFRRSSPWKDDENPGFGASYTDKACSHTAGNTFDFVSLHGRALLLLGHSFCSSSVSAFSGDSSDGIVDIICGKQQATLPLRNGRARFEVFPESLLEALRSFTSKGGNVIISGARIASGHDSMGEVEKLLGYKYVSDHAGKDGKVTCGGQRIELFNSRNPYRYFVERNDAIRPAGSGGTVIARYGSDSLPAGVFHNAGGYRTVAFGFPLECVKDSARMTMLLQGALERIGL